MVAIRTVKRNPPRHWSALLATIALAWPAAAWSQVDSGPSLSGAKDQLDAVRAETRTDLPASGQRSGLSTPAVPALVIPTEPAPPTPGLSERELKRRARRERAAANWLVEGVMKGERRGSGPLGIAGGWEEQRWDESEDENPFLASALAADSGNSGSQPKTKQRPVTAPNPFAPFLSTWLTDQPGSALQSSVRGNPATAAADAGDATRASGQERRINPYLQGLAAVDVPQAAAAPPPASSDAGRSAPAGGAATGVSAPSSAAAPAPKVPFVPPPNEEKYYKPLKRF